MQDTNLTESNLVSNEMDINLDMLGLLMVADR